MKRLLFPLLAVLALPTAVNADPYENWFNDEWWSNRDSESPPLTNKEIVLKKLPYCGSLIDFDFDEALLGDKKELIKKSCQDLYKKWRYTLKWLPEISNKKWFNYFNEKIVKEQESFQKKCVKAEDYAGCMKTQHNIPISVNARAMAASIYGVALCGVNQGIRKRETALEFVLEAVTTDKRIDPIYFKDKRIELMGRRIAEKSGNKCVINLTTDEKWEMFKFLSVNPIKEESTLYNSFFNLYKFPIESNINNKIIKKNNDEKHSFCLKAADYKGCMNYQNR